MSHPSNSSTRAIKLAGFCLGNAALIAYVVRKLKKSNPSHTPSEIITPKNVLYGYVAMTSALSFIPFCYLQPSTLMNIPSTFPHWLLNKYFPWSLDPNLSKPDKFDSNVLLKRILYIVPFFVHHSIFARHAVKQWMSRNHIIPARIERVLYMNVSNVLLLYAIAHWNEPQRTTDATETEHDEQETEDTYLWRIPFWSDTPWIVQYLPAFILSMMGQQALMSVCRSEEEFAGIANAFDVDFYKHAQDMNDVDEQSKKELVSPPLYELVRHPQMFFNLLSFLCVPRMSVSRLTFASLMAVYVCIAVQLEELDLIKEFGTAYVEYQKRVPQLIPSKSSVSNYIAAVKAAK